jgi:hypothetical protein
MPKQEGTIKYEEPEAYGMSCIRKKSGNVRTAQNYMSISEFGF